jgi:hypothetical protein
MPRITIPKTIEAAKERLNAIAMDRRLSGWERAAIVWAHTNSMVNGQHTPSPDGEGSRKDIAEALGLSTRTIDRARKAWKTAMEKHGAPDIQPGEDVPQFILDLDYPPTEETDDTGMTRDERGARALIARNPQVVVDAVKAVPAVAEAVTTAIAHDTDLHSTVERKAFAKSIGAREPGPAKTPVSNIPTYEREKELAKAITVVTEAIKDEESGAWAPGPGEVAMLTILFLNLKDRADRIVAAQPAIHGEIDDFLKTAKE